MKREKQSREKKLLDEEKEAAAAAVVVACSFIYSFFKNIDLIFACIASLLLD
jgi:hypothetical protein